LGIRDEDPLGSDVHLVGLMTGMVLECIPYSRLPGATRLAGDFLYAFEKVARFYVYDPWDAASVLRRVEKMDYPRNRREALVQVLRVQNPGSEAVERLREPDTVVVITGQQVGFLTGPVYTLYKALSAVKVAQELCDRGIPAVPVFWMATEDHDYDEVAECWVFDHRGAAVRMHAGRTEGAGVRPCGELDVPEWPIEMLESTLGQLPHGRKAVDLARKFYRPGQRLARAFGGLLGELVGEGRLMLFDPLGPEARELLAPILMEAAERARELVEAVRARTGEVEALGYHAQVRVEPEPTLLFMLQAGRRVPIRMEGGGFQDCGKRFGKTELERVARDLSPGALLRPVVQDWAFPAAVSVVGPAELAYLAQASAIYEVLGVGQPVRRPRVSCTLLDRACAGVLERFGLSLEGVFGPETALREAIGRQLRPVELATAVERAQAEVVSALDRIGAALVGWRGAVGRNFEKSRSKILYQMGKIERSIAREMVRRDRGADEGVRRLLGFAYPGRRLQERVYSALAFIALWGMDFVAAVEQAVAWDCRDHQVVVL